MFDMKPSSRNTSFLTTEKRKGILDETKIKLPAPTDYSPKIDLNKNGIKIYTA